jgi:hypothetical protein
MHPALLVCKGKRSKVGAEEEEAAADIEVEAVVAVLVVLACSRGPVGRECKCRWHALPLVEAEEEAPFVEAEEAACSMDPVGLNVFADYIIKY